MSARPWRPAWAEGGDLPVPADKTPGGILEGENRSMTKRASVLMAALAAAVLAGCAGGAGNTSVKQPLSENLKGNLDVRTVRVDKLPSVDSMQIVGIVRKALKRKVGGRLNRGRRAEIHVTIEKYYGPEDEVGGFTAAVFFGSESSIQALIKVIDPHSKAILSEYRAVAEHSKGGILNSEKPTKDPHQGLMQKLTDFAVEPLG